MDTFWNFLTMPFGVAMCFGPAMIVWWFTKGDKPDEDGPASGH